LRLVEGVFPVLQRQEVTSNGSWTSNPRRGDPSAGAGRGPHVLVVPSWVRSAAGTSGGTARTPPRHRGLAVVRLVVASGSSPQRQGARVDRHGRDDGVSLTVVVSRTGCPCGYLATGQARPRKHVLDMSTHPCDPCESAQRRLRRERLHDAMFVVIAVNTRQGQPPPMSSRRIRPFAGERDRPSHGGDREPTRRS